MAAAAAHLRGCSRSVSCVRAPTARSYMLARLSSSVRARATTQDVIDLDAAAVSLRGPSLASAASDAAPPRLSADELVDAAARTHYASMAAADLEVALSADGSSAIGYLAALAAEGTDALQRPGGRGLAADAAATALAAEADVAVPEAHVTADLGAATAASAGDSGDVLERLVNDEALQARRVVSALKLSRQELAEHVLPGDDWDAATIDWFTTRDAGGSAAGGGSAAPAPRYRLTFLWLDKNVAVAVDQVFGGAGNDSLTSVAPLTEFFVWPRRDAWEELKLALEARPWIGDRDKVLLLNRLTEVINFWMGGTAAAGGSADGSGDAAGQVLRPTIDEARAAFPDCVFAGAL